MGAPDMYNEYEEILYHFQRLILDLGYIYHPTTHLGCVRAKECSKRVEAHL